MPYLHTERIVAWVPKGKKYYVCGICGVNFNFVKMKDHLERDHNRKVSGGGYAFYNEENETK